ncbi:O-methyltransferase [Streptomyces sp. NPDC004539]|uniref:O-methyltransferase n=1 Tax=Streptomyces sp. NPDC004539 TaxID=3154280 RepID=UPI0033B10DE8
MNRCLTVPDPSPYGETTPLHLPEPGTTPPACACRQPVEADLRVLRTATAGTRPNALRAPDDPRARARYRWLVGHHAAFAVWQHLRRTLETALDDPTALLEAARLYDVYSVLFLYTGSCSPERYAETIRPGMTARHPAFSGEWARDHEGLTALARKVRDQYPAALAAPLTDAVRLNQRVHMKVAARLVPGGASLLQDAGRQPGRHPTPAEHDLYDTHFAVHRLPVCDSSLTAQLVRRLAQIVCDIAEHGLTDHDPHPLTDDLLRSFAEALGSPRMQDVKTVSMTTGLYDYLLTQAEPPTPVQRRLMAETRDLGQVAEMQIPHEQSVLLTLLTKITGARLVVEVGTFTGASTLAFALGLPPGGQVITCDISDEWTGIARRAWQDAGVADSVRLLLGPAEETLRSLSEDPVIDLAFLDADKPGYETYWDLLVPRLRPGGLLLADNVLYGGDAADPHCTGNARAIRAFNARVRADERMESVLLPVADGLTVARKRDTP